MEDAPVQLFDLAQRYVSRQSPFDTLFAAALERILTAPPESAEAELAALIVAVEAEHGAGEYSAAEGYGRIADFVAARRPSAIGADQV